MLRHTHSTQELSTSDPSPRTSGLHAKRDQSTCSTLPERKQQSLQGKLLVNNLNLVLGALAPGFSILPQGLFAAE